ncbi:hypothetical protein AB0K49_26880 [Streptomyces decoyicus]|uniref:hypothetical protein n=1 Tax=Streptomyces decoyicus TaxID=249567 RepID=UPI00345DAA21
MSKVSTYGEKALGSAEGVAEGVGEAEGAPLFDREGFTGPGFPGRSWSSLEQPASNDAATTAATAAAMVAGFGLRLLRGTCASA